MKALSLWQPHVLAIALGLKRWETRDWATRYRGPIALQAARRKWVDGGPWHIQATRKLRRALCPSMPEQLSDAASYTLLQGEMHYGCVVCMAELVDCVPTSTLRGRIPDEHEFWGDFGDGERGEGRFAFRMDNVRVLEQPVLVMGKQGFFDVDLATGFAPPAMDSLFGPEP